MVAPGYIVHAPLCSARILAHGPLSSSLHPGDILHTFFNIMDEDIGDYDVGAKVPVDRCCISGHDHI